MEHCPEHSGLVEAVNNLKDTNEKMSESLDKLTDAIINMKVETAKTSARIGVKWGAVATGLVIGIYKVFELIATKWESIPK